MGENYTNENGILVNDTCHEEWNCILDKMIFLWREAEKDTCSQKNPFDEAHSKAMDEFTERFGLFGNKLQTEKELEENRKRGGGGTIHFMDAEKLRKESGNLTEEKMAEVLEALQIKHSDGNAGVSLKLPKTICNKYFEGMNSKQMASVVEQALVAWFEGKEDAVV